MTFSTGFSAPERPPSRCVGCGKTAADIPEYGPESTGEEGRFADPEEYVWDQEGTLNHANGHFACTECYIKMGSPSSRYGWKAP